MGMTLFLAFVLALVLFALAVVIRWPFGGALALPRRSPRPRPAAASPAATAARPAPAREQASAAIAPTAPLPRPRPAAPRPAERPLDPGDPTVKRWQGVSARLALTREAVEALPQALEERVAMGSGLLACEYRLGQIRASLAAGAGGGLWQRNELEKLDRRLASIRGDAERLSAHLALLAERERRLSEEALLLGDELAAMARLTPYPIALDQTAAASADALGRVSRIPARAAISGRNALNWRLREAEELRADIARCRAALAQARVRRDELLAALASPELAEDAAWHRTLRALRDRARAGSDPGLPEPLVRPLSADADLLLARRHALFDFCTPLSGRDYLISEERLPGLLDEATALRDEIRALWQRARELVGTRRVTA